MKLETSVQNLLFDVDQVPIEAVVGSNGSTRRISIPGKKALLNQRTGLVLGVVSRDYRVVTNQEAINLAREVCDKAFPGLSSVEWEAKRGAAPRTLSYPHRHRRPTARKRLFPKGPRHHREAFRPLAQGISSPEPDHRVRSECMDSGMGSRCGRSADSGEKLEALKH